jgi:hypothetical protein
MWNGLCSYVRGREIVIWIRRISMDEQIDEGVLLHSRRSWSPERRQISPTRKERLQC